MSTQPPVDGWHRATRQVAGVGGHVFAVPLHVALAWQVPPISQRPASQGAPTLTARVGMPLLREHTSRVHWSGPALTVGVPAQPPSPWHTSFAVQATPSSQAPVRSA